MSEGFLHESSTTEEVPDKDEVRDELISLSEKGEIKQTVNYIKKANQNALEKIKRDYERKQLDGTNEVISENLVSEFSNLMESLNMIDDSEIMKENLTGNALLKRDLKKIVGMVTPYIPYIGLVSGGVVVARHFFNKRYNGEQEQRDEE